ncbi:MAG: HAD family hydrolase, partial [Clostridia bacterium]|nr:HAD family hydrolase [Clostridia bacterium]
PKADVKGLLSSLRRKGYGVVLATNPLFPPVAVASRLSWILLSPSDFDHVTTYDNSRFCKPHLGYYRDILAKVSREPAQCMMVGNNPVDDMAAADLGLAVYLLTDYLENPEGLEIGGYPQGSFADLAAFLGELPALPAG